MRKFYAIAIFCVLLAGCSQDKGTKTLDLSSLSSTDKQTEKTESKAVDKTYNGEKGREVLLKAFEEADKDKAYDMSIKYRFAVTDINGSDLQYGQKIRNLFSSVKYKEIKRVDKVAKKIEGTQEIEMLAASQMLNLTTLYVYENNNYYVYEPIQLKSISDIPNGSFKKVTGGEVDDMTANMDANIDSFAIHKNYVEKADKTSFATKQLTEDDKAKGYAKAIAVKVIDESLADVDAFTGSLVGQYAITLEKVEKMMFVFWLDEDGKIKKVTEQYDMGISDDKNNYLMNVQTEYTYSGKQKMEFAIGEEKLAR